MYQLHFDYKAEPEATLKDLVNILLSNGKVCTPVIAPDGSIKIGESALCPKIASIYDSVPEIMERFVMRNVVHVRFHGKN